MDNLVPATSLRQNAVTRPAVIATHPNDGAALAKLWKRYGAEPVRLVRTPEGRQFSRARYRRAWAFTSSLCPEAPGDWPHFLYSAGIVVQLALSSHLLDVGFPDAWCARHISLHVDRALAYANATAFGYECTETARLMQVLSPYWKWNAMHLTQGAHPDDGGFTPDQVRERVGALLDHVRQVTGHARPRGRVMLS
jgi:hypothetical protein